LHRDQLHERTRIARSVPCEKQKRWAPYHFEPTSQVVSQPTLNRPLRHVAPAALPGLCHARLQRLQGDRILVSESEVGTERGEGQRPWLQHQLDTLMIVCTFRQPAQSSPRRRQPGRTSYYVQSASTSYYVVLRPVRIRRSPLAVRAAAARRCACFRWEPPMSEGRAGWGGGLEGLGG
jgi:hypothetical protein